MTATSAAAGEIARYLDAVGLLLGDLPADEREEVLEDLAVHLREVAAEADEPLEQILGRPEHFVAELRDSAGLDVDRAGVLAGRMTAARQRLAQGQRMAEENLALRWVRALLPELAPGWWVLRGYLVVLILAVLGGEHHFPFFPLVDLAGSAFLGLLATAGAVFASVQLGRRHRAAPRPWWIGVGNVLAVLATMVAFGNIRAHLGPEYVYTESQASFTGGLTHPDGSPITNLFPYGDDGTLLDGVLLYDQDGRPVAVADGEPVNPYDDLLDTDFPLDANGAEITHRYPLDQQTRQWQYGPQGEESVVAEPVRPPAVTPPRLATPSMSTSSTTTTAPVLSAPEPEPATSSPGA